KAKVKLGSHTFKSIADTIKVWTSSPNGNKDTFNFFDTLIVIKKPTPPPTASAGADRDMCFGTSTKVGTTGLTGHKYSWTSNPAGFTASGFNAVVSPTVTTTYKLVITNTATGCFGEDSVVVTVLSTPTVTMDTAKAICIGDSVQIGPAIVEPTYSYYWTSTPAGFTSNDANPYVKPGTTTKYKLTVSNINLCTAVDEVEVSVNPLPYAFSGVDKSVCKGQSTQIGWSPTTGNSYSWRSIPAGFSSTSSNPTVTPTADTTKYIVKVTNASGCVNEDEVMVTISPLPVANAGADTNICVGKSAKIGAASQTGYTYSWTSRPAGFTDFAANPTVSPKVTTTYKVLTRNANGCTSEDSVTVRIVAPPVAEAGAAKEICAGETVSIGTAAVSGVMYSWTSTPAGFTSTDAVVNVSPTVNTTYKVVATNATGCTSQSQVTVSIKPVPVANAGTAKSICPGVATQIGAAAVNGYSYSWTSVPAGFTSADANPTVSPNVTTTYKLVVTGAEGCKAESQVTITAALPQSNFTVKASGLKVDFKAVNTTYKKYEWNFRDGSFDTGATVTHTFPASGNFRVTLKVTHPDGCLSSTDSVITISGVGINRVETPVSGINIYPNPFTTGTTLCYTLQKRAQVNITLLDVTGKQIAELVNNTLPGGDYTQQVNADYYKLKPGIYFIQMQVDGAASTRKIMKVE
ncbi:MAG: Ig-like domain-containing protein, partial [Bacteroidia bacterium]